MQTKPWNFKHDTCTVEDCGKKHIAKGLTLDQAKLLVENDDKTLSNRKKTNAMNITRSDGSPSKTTYTQSDLENMNQSEYNKVKRMAEDGKVVIKR